MWFRVRVSNPRSHVIHWSCNHVIFKNTLSSPSLGQWPLLLARCDISWPQPSSHMNHLSCDHAILAKMCTSSFTAPMTTKLGRVERPHLLFQVTCRSSDHVLFGKRHGSTNKKLQNAAGDIKHRKTHKSKTFFVIQKIFKFDSHRHAPL